MVGRALIGLYRLALNFLSPSNYARCGAHYSRNLVRSIVRIATGSYDPSASSEITLSTEVYR